MRFGRNISRRSPAGTNPIFRERTEHDCSCCRNFVKNLGNVVAKSIHDDMKDMIVRMISFGEMVNSASVEDSVQKMQKIHRRLMAHMHIEDIQPQEKK